ncbi:MAG TPA: hypothetical protein VNG90_05320 [Candidatus Acidoferrum sp.]|nr:hypothetical protein [Candidatus Acidoferrum sp.]
MAQSIVKELSWEGFTPNASLLKANPQLDHPGKTWCLKAIFDYEDIGALPGVTKYSTFAAQLATALQFATFGSPKSLVRWAECVVLVHQPNPEQLKIELDIVVANLSTDGSELADQMWAIGGYVAAAIPSLLPLMWPTETEICGW